MNKNSSDKNSTGFESLSTEEKIGVFLEFIRSATTEVLMKLSDSIKETFGITSTLGSTPAVDSLQAEDSNDESEAKNEKKVEYSLKLIKDLPAVNKIKLIQKLSEIMGKAKGEKVSLVAVLNSIKKPSV